MRSHARLITVVLCACVALLTLAVWRIPVATPAARAAEQSNGIFVDSAQSLGNANSQGVALGNLDGVNGLDAFVANSAGGSRVWLNNGGGVFSSNGQSLGSLNAQAVALGNVNGNSAVDAVAANSNGSNQVWQNNGSGQFTAVQSFDSGVSQGIALGNLDGDGDLDVFVANNGANKVWLNNNGALSDSGQSLGASNSYDVALGDLDGDGDLDAFVANGSASLYPDKVWVNQGGAQSGTPGVFADSGQSLGFIWSYAVALADLDGDGDLDAFTASWSPPANKVWINQGGAQGGAPGVFADSGQNLGSSGSIGVALGNLNGANGADAFVTNSFPDGGKVWFNNGSGSFSDSGQALGAATTGYDAALGDLDGDSDLDAFVANFGPNRVYYNGGTGPPSATFDVDREANDNGDEIFYWTASSNAALPVLLSRPATQALNVYAGVQTAGGTTTQTIGFSIGQQIRFLNLVNPNPNPSRSITLTLRVGPSGPQTDRLVLIFIDQSQGFSDCILCYIEWLARLTGFDPQFNSLFQADVSATEDADLHAYFAALHNVYAGELTNIIAAHPSLLAASIDALNAWAPAVDSLDAGSGASSTVTSGMANSATSLLNGVKAKASQGLQAIIQHEQDAFDIPSMVGKDMDEVWMEVMARDISDIFVTVILK
jgi:hypothetical protein